MSERTGPPEADETDQSGTSRRGIIIGAIVAVAAIIVAVALLAGDPDDLAIDSDEPTPGAVDEASEEELDPDEDVPDPPEEPATDDPGTAIDRAAAWVVAQIADDGSVEAGFSEPVGNATQAALALAAAETGGDAFERAVRYVVEEHEEYVSGEEGDVPGALGYVILLAETAREDPRDFGGSDLVERVEAIERTDGDDIGLFGDADPEFDGAFRQAIALLGLAASDADPSDEAVAWLVGQQCPDGGWTAYRPPDRRDGDCDPEEDAPDTNSTALAVQALIALDVEPEHDPLEWLEEAQNEDGGFGYGGAFGATDSNSTGLVLQALAAAGEDPRGDRWTVGEDADPITALLRLQLGCDADEAERGAFAFQPEEDGSLVANPATKQAIWGLSGAPFPFDERTPAGTPPAC